MMKNSFASFSLRGQEPIPLSGPVTILAEEQKVCRVSVYM